MTISTLVEMYMIEIGYTISNFRLRLILVLIMEMWTIFLGNIMAMALLAATTQDTLDYRYAMNDGSIICMSA